MEQQKELKSEDAIVKLLDIYTTECEDSLCRVSEDLSYDLADLVERIWYLKTIGDEVERVSKLLKARLNEYYPEGVELEVKTERGTYVANHRFRNGYIRPACDIPDSYAWSFKRTYTAL